MNIEMLDPFAVSGPDMLSVLGAMAKIGAWGGGFFFLVTLALVLWLSYSELKHQRRA